MPSWRWPAAESGQGCVDCCCHDCDRHSWNRRRKTGNAPTGCGQLEAEAVGRELDAQAIGRSVALPPVPGGMEGADMSADEIRIQLRAGKPNRRREVLFEITRPGRSHYYTWHSDYQQDLGWPFFNNRNKTEAGATEISCTEPTPISTPYKSCFLRKPPLHRRQDS